MWYIIIKGHRQYLTPKENFVFGRKNGDLVFPNDQSMSRTHASICVIPKTELKVGEPTSLCVIKDQNSKYGSYILHEGNKTQISTEGYELKDGDEVQLGLQDVVFTIVHVPIVTMTSSLNHEDITNLGNFLTNHIDGVIATKWTKCCTHLTTIKPQLTEKVLLAMAAGIPIVRLDYWEKVRVAMRKDEPIPDPRNFTPEIAELMINKSNVSLCANMERKTLFKDKLFVFLCKQQYETYREIIRLAGGNAVVYSRSSFTVKNLCTPKVIVIQFPLDDLSESTQNVVPDYNEICDALKAARRRMIPVRDIPLSLLHCSTEKFCNPMFRMEKLLIQRPLETDKSETLAMDTPDVTILPSVVSNVRVQVAVRHNELQIVPETCDDFTDEDRDFIKNRANEESHESQNSVLSHKRKREIIPETIESQEESIGTGKRSRISSDESILVLDTNESSAPPVFQEGKIDAFVQNDRAKRDIYDFVNDLTEIQIIPKKSVINKALEKEKGTFEASRESHKSQNSELSHKGKKAIIPESIESQEESNGNGKRSRISSDESILVLDTNESSAPPVFQEGKDAFMQNNRTIRDIYDFVNDLTEIQIIPNNKVLEKKKATFEASCERDKSEIGTEIAEIIPETSKKNVEYSDRNLMPTSPIRLGDDIFSNSFETPILERQTTRNVSLKEKADKNCVGKFTEGGTWRSTRNEASKWITVPLQENSNTTYKRKMNLRTPIGKTFKKVYQVQKPPFRGYYNS